MATGATYAVEELLAVDDGGADDRVLGDDAARHLQSGLEQGSGGDICPGQFVHETIAIGIKVEAKALLGLNAVMMVKGVVGELA